MLTDYVVASLLDHYRLTLDEILDLTESQVFELYYYPREENGTLKSPKTVIENKENGYEKDLACLLQLKNMRMLKDYPEKLKQLKKKWGKE